MRRERKGEVTDKGARQPQFDKFKKLAEEVGCEDNDAAFDKTLKRLSETPPPETVEKRKTQRGKRRS